MKTYVRFCFAVCVELLFGWAWTDRSAQSGIRGRRRVAGIGAVRLVRFCAGVSNLRRDLPLTRVLDWQSWSWPSGHCAVGSTSFVARCHRSASGNVADLTQELDCALMDCCYFQGTHNAGQRIIDGVGVVSDFVGGILPTRFVGEWLSDNIAPSYWVPNASIKVQWAASFKACIPATDCFSRISSAATAAARPSRTLTASITAALVDKAFARLAPTTGGPCLSVAGAPILCGCAEIVPKWWRAPTTSLLPKSQRLDAWAKRWRELWARWLSPSTTLRHWWKALRGLLTGCPTMKS